MRILILAGRYDQISVGGVSRFLSNVIPRLARDHQIKVLAARKHSERRVLRAHAEKNIHVHYVNALNLRLIPRSWAFLLIFRFLLHMIALRKKWSFNLVYSHEWVSGVSTRILSKLTGRNFLHIHHPHGLASLVAEFERRKLASKNLFWPLVIASMSRLEKKNISDVDGVVVFSEELEAHARSMGAREVALIPSGVDAEKFNPNLPEDDLLKLHPNIREGPRIVYCGRIVHVKGIEQLIKAFAIVAEKNKGVRLILAGSFPEEPQSYWQSIADSHGVGDRTIFPGRVDEKHLPQLMKSANIYCQLTTPYLAFELSLMEACASGAPCIAIESMERRSIFRDAVEYVPLGDHIHTAAAIEKLLSDRNAAKILGDKARRLALEYSWDKTSDKLLNFFQHLASRYVAR